MDSKTFVGVFPVDFGALTFQCSTRNSHLTAWASSRIRMWQVAGGPPSSVPQSRALHAVPVHPCWTSTLQRSRNLLFPHERFYSFIRCLSTDETYLLRTCGGGCPRIYQVVMSPIYISVLFAVSIISLFVKVCWKELSAIAYLCGLDYPLDGFTTSLYISLRASGADRFFSFRCVFAEVLYSELLHYILLSKGGIDGSCCSAK